MDKILKMVRFFNDFTASRSLIFYKHVERDRFSNITGDVPIQVFRMMNLQIFRLGIFIGELRFWISDERKQFTTQLGKSENYILYEFVV